MDLLRSLPLGLYLEQPLTWLHRLDPRIKLGWLMTFLAAPILASVAWRFLLVAILIALTLSARIPLRVWRQQMGWLLMLSLFVLLLTAIAPDGLNLDQQSRLPADALAFAQQPATVPPVPQRSPWYAPFSSGKQPAAQTTVPDLTQLPQPTAYNYILFRQGAVKVTQRSWELATRVSTLLFTLIYSTNLFLLTTAPEEITAGIESLMQPLRRFRIPVTEIALTLTLSLRFIPLVLEEVQNLMRSVSTRAINWQKLGVRRAIQVWLIVAERLLENLLLRAEQISSAMQVRGFTSPNQHKVEWHQLHLRRVDWLAIAGLLILWSARLIWGNEV